MKLNSKDIEELKKILAVCKVLDIEGIIINEGLVRGAKPSLDAAIISKNNLSISEALSLGIGRVAELDKRLAIFGPDVQIEGKTNDAGVVSLLTMQSGKTKMQFRCTSAALMRAPKSNDDVPSATVRITKAEAQLMSKAIKTLSAEHVILQVKRDGSARLEASDSANDKFEIELSQQVKYADEETSLVHKYLGPMFVDVIDTATKESEEIDLVIGEVGSITATIKGHTIMIMSQISGEED